MTSTRGSDRIGLFGGTFDPPHNGHLVAAVTARHQLGIAEVLMVVAGDPWQKAAAVDAPASDRMEMMRLACEGIEGLVPCDVEVRRSGPTYTIDTVNNLRSAQPNVSEVVLILGADAVAKLDSWHRADELAAMVSIAAMPRWDSNGERIAVAAPSARWDVTELRMPRLDIESTAVRSACAAGAPIDGLVPPAVVRYVRDHRLYTRMR